VKCVSAIIVPFFEVTLNIRFSIQYDITKTRISNEREGEKDRSEIES